MKRNRIESMKGCDVIGFHVNDDSVDPNDELFVFESKASMSGKQVGESIAGRCNELPCNVLHTPIRHMGRHQGFEQPTMVCHFQVKQLMKNHEVLKRLKSARYCFSVEDKTCGYNFRCT
jgi:hypothetical protein